MYIPLAVHKNELIVVDSMETFSHYFCLAKKQKMTPLIGGDGVLTADESNDEISPYFDDGAEEATADGLEDDI